MKVVAKKVIVMTKMKAVGMKVAAVTKNKTNKKL